MKVGLYEETQQRPVDMEGASGCLIRWLVHPSDGVDNFAMRQFEVEPGGFTPRHHHPYEHEIFVIEGEGVVVEGDQEHSIKPGSVVYIVPDEVHQFRNTGDVPLKFLCLVPNVATLPTTPVTPECG